MAPPIDKDIRIYKDNEEAIKMWKIRSSSRRTRHLHLNYHIVHDAIERGVVCVEHMRSEEQHAHIFTKALDVNTFGRHQKILLNSQ